MTRGPCPAAVQPGARCPLRNATSANPPREQRKKRRVRPTPPRRRAKPVSGCPRRLRGRVREVIRSGDANPIKKSPAGPGMLRNVRLCSRLFDSIPSARVQGCLLLAVNGCPIITTATSAPDGRSVGLWADTAGLLTDEESVCARTLPGSWQRLAPGHYGALRTHVRTAA